MSTSGLWSFKCDFSRLAFIVGLDFVLVLAPAGLLRVWGTALQFSSEAGKILLW